MTCYYQIDGTAIDVYDHEGNLIAENVEFGGRWSGDYPDIVTDKLYNARDDSQPTAYNQELLFCLAAGQIERGSPP